MSAEPKRTFTTEVRIDWQDMVAQTLKSIDRHAQYPHDDFHMRNYYILKQYLIDLKSWIKAEEERLENKNE
tara:strand:+ start:98 stop:310 length:213 start_codon:yes stop_codon:yes gene_type:complete